MRSNVVHRWQPTGMTPCGREVSKVKTNLGYYLSDGVTCKHCNRAKWRVARHSKGGAL
jgi:hypothetical protein